MAVNYCKDKIMVKQFAEVCDLNPLYTISNVCKKVSKLSLLSLNQDIHKQPTSESFSLLCHNPRK